MKATLKAVYFRYKKLFDITIVPFDFLLSLVVIPAAYLLLLFRAIGSSLFPKTSARLKKIGVYPVRNHYYEPLFDHTLLRSPLQAVRNLPGVELNESAQLALLNSLSFSRELVDLELSKKKVAFESFYIGNRSFAAGDAEIFYQLIRHLKPKKVIEIGGGNSTKLARLALQKNYEENRQSYNHICIEPYEQPWLEKLDNVTIIRERVEECEIDWASELSSGDLLFIDSSHVIRPQGDVLSEYLEIIPILRSGVVVHAHDIFTPRDYLRNWIVDDVRFWNEQYILEALLTNTDRYEVVAALNFLRHKHFEQLQRVCPYLTPSNEPGSFYFRVKEYARGPLVADC